MLEQIITTKVWEETFQKKFSNFCKKSPVLLKMQVKIQDGNKGVLITHVNTETKYFFPFDYDANIKDFIAEIKRLLVAKHYPRIIEEILERHEKTNAELAVELESGKKVEELEKFCMRKTGERMYRIDKVLPWKETAFLELENSDIPGDVLGTQYHYKFDKSLVLYLRDYRTGKFKSIEEASDEFFNNAFLVSILGEKKKQKQKEVQEQEAPKKTEEPEKTEDTSEKEEVKEDGNNNSADNS